MTDACCDANAPRPGDAHAHQAGTPAAWRWFVIAAAMAIGLGEVSAWFGAETVAHLCDAAAVALMIGPPARRAWHAARSRALDINVLMVVAVGGAIVLGEWLEAAAVVWLFGVSQWLESLSMTRARRAIRGLMTMAPSEALRRSGETETVVPVSELRLGDIVIVRPGERVPVDGRVVAGESAVNQAPVTGESWPSGKAAGDPVFAGSVNGNGALEVLVERIAADSTIARIIHLVERAQAQRAPMQTFVDRFARQYTPAVVVMAVLLAVVPPVIGSVEALSFTGGEWALWAYRSLVLLVVACPCALVISTPVSIVSALTAAARAGVLIKGGVPLERLASVRCIAFDKTGTLTAGRIQVTEVLGVNDTTAQEVLSVAASLESRSEHPIGRAIVDRAREAGLTILSGDRFRALPGLGAEALVAASPAVIGSHRLFEDRQLCTPALHARSDQVEAGGGTPVFVGRDGAALGVIGLADQMRVGGRETVAELRLSGVDHIVLLTGDTRRSATAIGSASGLDEVYGDLMPDDKVKLVELLRREHGPVAMIGDGVNDAPALAAADVGIAMGAAGTDVALETADVALMADDLSKLPFAVRLSRATLRTIHVNVTMAIGLKAAFIVLAALGVATLWMAVVADTGASILVTANSLRLLRQK